MKQYLNLLNRILNNGHQHVDRTGVGRISLYGEILKFDLRLGFPLVTTRKVPYKAIIKELLWFIKGSTNVKELQDQHVHIWDSWAVTEQDIDAFCEKYQIGGGDSELKKTLADHFLNSIGHMYGDLWRNAPVSDVCLFYPEVIEEEVASDKLAKYKEQFLTMQLCGHDKGDWKAYLKAAHYNSVDQLQQLVVNLKKRPFSARHIVNCWMPTYLPFEDLPPQENVLLGRSALAACHVMFQCFVIPSAGKNKLSMMLTQRSADFPVGSVFNIAQYAILLHLLAHVCGYEAYELIYSLGDVHIYTNQVEDVKRQLTHTPLPLAKITISDDVTDIYQCKLEDIVISDYVSHSAIHYPVAV